MRIAAREGERLLGRRLARLFRMTSMLESSFEALNISRVSALRIMIERHRDTVSRILLTRKESLEKRSMIESAFRACRDAFVEMSDVFTNLLEERSTHNNSLEADIRKAVVDTLDETRGRGSMAEGNECVGRSYASVVDSSRTEVQVMKGLTIEPSNSTSFLVVSEEGSKVKYSLSGKVRDALCRLLKPAECGLRVNRLTLTRNGGVRVEAQSPDLEKIKAYPSLVNTGFNVRLNVKSNPRLIVHGIPSDMAEDEIREELIAQNLRDDEASQVKFIYRF